MSDRIDSRAGRKEPRKGAGVFTAFGLAAEAEPLPAGLYVVATPIGNLRDVTFRALSVLAAAAAVLAEDTRITKRLLAHYGITTPLLTYNDHSSEAVRERMIHRLREGEALALVSDAGTPLVSDPGYRLVQAAIAAGLPVTPIPGPSAMLTALVVSGLPTDRWVFEGFLPRRPNERRERLRALAHDPRTVVLFESPLRVITLLRDVLVELGDRRAAVARELTKLHEEVVRGRVSEVIASLLDSEPRGELVVVIEGAEAVAPDLNEMVEEARRLVADGMRKREAAAAVARRGGGSANEIYGALVDPEGAPED